MSEQSESWTAAYNATCEAGNIIDELDPEPPSEPGALDAWAERHEEAARQASLAASNARDEAARIRTKRAANGPR